MNIPKTNRYQKPLTNSQKPYKHTPKQAVVSHTTHSWKQAVVGSFLAVLGLGSTVTAYAQDDGSVTEVAFGVNAGNNISRLCNNGYVEHKKQIYEVSALHCKTGATGHEAVNKDDIVYTRVSSGPIGARVMSILDGHSIDKGELHKKEVTVKLCVYNVEGEVGRNRYCKPFVEKAQYDSGRGMYFVEIPLHIKRWYTENVSELGRGKMKSSSGSPVEWQEKFVGVISGIGFNSSNQIGSTGMKPYEGRLYFAPAKTNPSKYST